MYDNDNKKEAVIKKVALKDSDSSQSVQNDEYHRLEYKRRYWHLNKEEINRRRRETRKLKLSTYNLELAKNKEYTFEHFRVDFESALKKKKERQERYRKAHREELRQRDCERRVQKRRLAHNELSYNFSTQLNKTRSAISLEDKQQIVTQTTDSAIQMKVVADVHEQHRQHSQRNIRPYSNAERQRRYREKNKRTTFSQSSPVQLQQGQPQNYVQINQCRKLLRERQQRRHMEDINAITSSIGQLQK